MVFISAASIDLTKTEHVIALEDCGITAVSRGSSEGRARDGGGGGKQVIKSVNTRGRVCLF